MLRNQSAPGTHHSGSGEAAAKIAVILSIFETCKRHQINRCDYRNDVLPKLPAGSILHVAELPPSARK